MRIAGWILVLSLALLAARGLVLLDGDVNWWAPLTDETPTGNVAAALASGGLVMPWQAYQFKPFAGGTVLEGLLAFPFFKLWGDRLISLRAAPILICILTMIAWMLFLDRHFSRRAAIVAGLLFALPPPLYGLLSVTAWGNHTESALLTVIALWWLVAMLGAGRPRRASALAGLGLGALCGLGLWFTYTFGVTVAMLLILWPLLDPRWPRDRAFLAFWPGMIIGLVPWYLNLSFWGGRAMFRIDTYTGYEGTTFVEGSRLFLETDLAGTLGKGLRLIFHGLPRASLFPAWMGIPGAAFSIAFFCLALAAGILILLRHRGSLSNPFRRNRARALDPRLSILFFPPLFCLVLAISGFRVEDFRLSRPQEYVNYRYLGPALPFVFAWIGAGADSLINSLKQRRIASIASSALIMMLVGAFGLLPCLDLASARNAQFLVLKFRGSDPQLVLDRLAGLVGGAEQSTTLSLDVLRQLPEAQVRIAFEHFGYIGPPASDLAEQMDGQALGAYLRFLNRGFGRLAARRLLDSGGRAGLTDLCGLLDDIYGRARPGQRPDERFWEGVGMQLGETIVGQPAALTAEADRLGIPAEQPAAARSVAVVVRLVPLCQNGAPRSGAIERGIGRASVEAFNVMPGQAPIVGSGGFYFGVGAQLRRNALLDLVQDDIARAALFRVPKEFRRYAVRGWIEESEQLGIGL